MESQNIEYKETWKDEYLKWICGFANAQGGRIYIGRKDDGAVVGVRNARKLMEDIPNKIQNKLGIVADVNLLAERGLEYIEIVVSPWSFPVNYNGEYHYRSGSTKQRLSGGSLTNFLISKTGMKWDASAVDKITVADLDNESFDIFRREALRSGRMTKEDLEMSDKELLEKLDLMVDGKLRRAGALCFCRNADRIISGCYVKVGSFDGSELLYQDEVHGSLLFMADRTIDLIFLKYLKASVSYHKETRVETYPYARDAVREAVYNSLIHCNWANNNPIQIRIDEDEMHISNSSLLPFGWTAETLLGSHSSQPFNPGIARVFYRAGYIENWGRGIQRICNACKALGADEPEYIVHGEDIMLKFKALQSARIPDRRPAEVQDRPMDESSGGPSERARGAAENDARAGFPEASLNDARRGPLDEPLERARGTVESDAKAGLPETSLNDAKREPSEGPSAEPLGDPSEGPLDDPLDEGILQILKDAPDCTYEVLAKTLGVSRSTVKRSIKLLSERGRIMRIDGKRYGYWEITRGRRRKASDH